MEQAIKKAGRTSMSDEVLSLMTALAAGFFCNRLGLEEYQANEAAMDLIDEFRKEFGGSLIYFNIGMSYDADEEAAAILADFEAGQTITELVIAYKKSMAQIYQKIKKARQNRRLAQQKAENSVKGLI